MIILALWLGLSGSVIGFTIPSTILINNSELKNSIMSKKINYEIGIPINGIIYLGDVLVKKCNHRIAKFLCVCGNEFTTSIDNVKRGHSKSCGCFKIHEIKKRITTHRKTGSKSYIAWSGIKSRCNNPKNKEYCRYGGRGITMSLEFNEPAVFCKYIESLKDFGKQGYTLDRIDNNGNYEKGNLRYASSFLQATNRRMPSSNKSGYTGIMKRGKKWSANIRYTGIQKYFGVFKTKTEALNARNNFIIENNLSHKIQKA